MKLFNECLMCFNSFFLSGFMYKQISDNNLWENQKTKLEVKNTYEEKIIDSNFIEKYVWWVEVLVNIWWSSDWLTDKEKNYKHLIISISPPEHRKFTEKNKIKFRLINNKTEFNEIWFLIFDFRISFISKQVTILFQHPLLLGFNFQRNAYQFQK
jgi:hypothetical protein